MRTVGQEFVLLALLFPLQPETALCGLWKNPRSSRISQITSGTVVLVTQLPNGLILFHLAI